VHLVETYCVSVTVTVVVTVGSGVVVVVVVGGGVVVDVVVVVGGEVVVVIVVVVPVFVVVTMYIAGLSGLPQRLTKSFPRLVWAWVFPRGLRSRFLGLCGPVCT